MADIERLSDVAESLATQDSTKPSMSTSVVSSVAMSGTNPLPNIYAVDNTERSNMSGTGPQDLPSRKLQYSQWHELRRTEVKGSQLKAPRVRRGPGDKEREFYELADEENQKIHHELKGRQRRRHRDDVEDWETAKIASFTRQEMYHSYQQGSLGRILDRLRSVIYLNLQDNEILSLSSYSFPRCEYINLDDNYMTSLTQLPKVKSVKCLTARRNGISSLNGLADLTSAPLEELYLSENPVSFAIGYRYQVFSILPKLKILDGVIKQEEDMVEPKNMDTSLGGKGCTIL